MGVTVGSSLCRRARRVHSHFVLPASMQPLYDEACISFTMRAHRMHASKGVRQRHHPSRPVSNTGIMQDPVRCGSAKPLRLPRHGAPSHLSYTRDMNARMQNQNPKTALDDVCCMTVTGTWSCLQPRQEGSCASYDSGQCGSYSTALTAVYTGSQSELCAPWASTA